MARRETWPERCDTQTSEVEVNLEWKVEVNLRWAVICDTQSTVYSDKQRRCSTMDRALVSKTRRCWFESSQRCNVRWREKTLSVRRVRRCIACPAGGKWWCGRGPLAIAGQSDMRTETQKPRRGGV